MIGLTEMVLLETALLAVALLRIVRSVDIRLASQNGC